MGQKPHQNSWRREAFREELYRFLSRQTWRPEEAQSLRLYRWLSVTHVNQSQGKHQHQLDDFNNIFARFSILTKAINLPRRRKQTREWKFYIDIPKKPHLLQGIASVEVFLHPTFSPSHIILQRPPFEVKRVCLLSQLRPNTSYAFNLPQIARIWYLRHFRQDSLRRRLAIILRSFVVLWSRHQKEAQSTSGIWSSPLYCAWSKSNLNL